MFTILLFRFIHIEHELDVSHRQAIFPLTAAQGREMVACAKLYNNNFEPSASDDLTHAFVQSNKTDNS